MTKQTERLLDRPLLRDWIAYLWALGIVAGVSETGSEYPTRDLLTGRVTGVDLSPAFWIALAFALGIQTLLFMVMPAFVRRVVRRRRMASRRIV